jgi:hypothetical protein
MREQFEFALDMYTYSDSTDELVEAWDFDYSNYQRYFKIMFVSEDMNLE